MATKYYYNGKLVKSSNGSKRAYKYAIYNKETGECANFSESREPLEKIRSDSWWKAQRKVSAYIAAGVTTGESFEYYKNMRAWWKAARVVKLDKVVTD